MKRTIFLQVEIADDADAADVEEATAAAVVQFEDVQAGPVAILDSSHTLEWTVSALVHFNVTRTVTAPTERAACGYAVRVLESDYPDATLIDIIDWSLLDPDEDDDGLEGDADRPL